MSKIKAAKEKLECSLVSEAGKANFLTVMKRFTRAHKPQCKSMALTSMPRVKRPRKTFITDSSYEGSWDLLGLCGYGIYTYPDGVIYEGDFEDGLFHGEGELRFESGAILRGSFTKGEMTKRNLIFADGLEYSETDWMYCRQPDRRFTIEYEFGIQPAGESFITADVPSPELPPDTYDAGDGAFDPHTLVVVKFDDPQYIIRAPSADEQEWTEANCRTNMPLPHEPRPYLYEKWMSPELELPPLPPPAALSAGSGADSSFFDYDQRHSSRTFNLEDCDEPTWRRRRSTAANFLPPKLKKALFYKPGEPTLIPPDTIGESDDEYQDPDVKDQDPGVKEEQDLDVKEEQDLDGKKEQDPNVEEDQDPGVKDDQDPGVKEEQDPDAKEEQGLDVKKEHDPDAEEDQDPGVMKEQDLDVKEEHDLAVNIEQDPDVMKEQDPDVEDEQDADVKDEQDPGVNGEQDLDVKEEQGLDVKKEQDPEVNEEQDPDVKEDQAM